jgi:hypothetical protein
MAGSHIMVRAASWSCSGWLRWRPQMHPDRSSGRSGSNGRSYIGIDSLPAGLSAAQEICNRYASAAGLRDDKKVMQDQRDKQQPEVRGWRARRRDA